MVTLKVKVSAHLYNLVRRVIDESYTWYNYRIFTCFFNRLGMSVGVVFLYA